jgi:hypothetical protein
MSTTTTEDDLPPTTCSGCGRTIPLDELVHSPEIEPIGMLIEPGFDLTLYFFNHTCPDCGTTFTRPIEDFHRFIEEPIPPELRAGQPGCGGACTRLGDLAVCHNECRNAPYRRFLLRMVAARKPK